VVKLVAVQVLLWIQYITEENAQSYQEATQLEQTGVTDKGNARSVAEVKLHKSYTAAKLTHLKNN
jgi:hypothetical protein